MTLWMVAAALYGVIQLVVISWPTRSVRLSTVLLAVLVGAYACGTAAALLELAYTRAVVGLTDHSLVEMVNTTSYTTAPWVEELLKVSPLLLMGLYAKVRRQWGLTDFTVMGAALGAGFGLLEALLRYSMDADRALARHGGWLIPDSLSPPFVPGPGEVLSSWLPSPAATLDLGRTGEVAVPTFTHLTWSALAGLAAGVLWRARGPIKVLAAIPFAAAVAHHTLNNYVAGRPGGEARDWLETLNGTLWSVPLVALLLALTADLVLLHRRRRTLPGVLLAGERSDGDTVATLVRYASWRFPWTPLIVLRFVQLRRALCYAAPSTPPAALEPLRREVADTAARIDATDRPQVWRTADIRAHVRAVRGAAGRRRRVVLNLVPCVLVLPSVLFLAVGSFKSTAGIQEYFSTGGGPRILQVFAVAALVWTTWILFLLLRTWRRASAHYLADRLAAHRLRFSSALASATAGTLLLWRSVGPVGADGTAIPAAHLLEALDRFLVYLGFALLLFSLLALFPPGAGLALAGVTATGEGAMGAALVVRLGMAGVALMAAGASGGSATTGSGGGGGSGQGANTPPAQQGSAPAPADAVGGHRTASGIARWAREQGWTETRTQNGPPKFTDENGIVRVTLKQGSSRAPGSGMPHVEIRNAQGERIDPHGNPVTRRSPGNHTPIVWDLP